MPWWLLKGLMAEADAGDEGTSGAGGTSAGDKGSEGRGTGGTGTAGASGGTGGDPVGGSDVSTQKADGEGSSAASTSPADWRQQYSGGDEKKAARLARYASPQAVVDALIAAQNRISAGELKAALPKDATPEQIATWRAEQGIPESADKYDLTFDNGLVVGEADKPIVDGFLAKMHAANLTQPQAKAAVEWYFEFQKEQQSVAAENAKRVTQETEDALRAEWGADYRGNVNAIEGLIDSYMPQGDDTLRTLILNGAKQNAGFAKMLANMALQLNPAGTLINAGNGGDITKSIADEIAKIENVMKTDRARYNKDEAMQAQLRKLYEARNAHQSRAA